MTERRNPIIGELRDNDERRLSDEERRDEQDRQRQVREASRAVSAAVGPHSPPCPQPQHSGGFERAVEAVARILCAADKMHPDGYSGHDPGQTPHWRHYTDEAAPYVRAVLQAIREPDEGMISMGFEAIRMEEKWPHMLDRVYRAMIDRLIEQAAPRDGASPLLKDGE